MSNRRRTITRIVVFLLLGAIINVAVAWGCTLCSQVKEVSHDVMSDSGKPAVPFDMSLFFAADSAFLKDYCQYRVEGRGIGIRETRVSRWSYNLIAENTGDVSSQLAGGFPRLSLEGGCRELDQMEWAIDLPRQWTARLRPFKVVQSSGVIRVRNYRTWLGNRAAPVFLPLRPIWPGFAINTAVYALLLWLLWLARGKVRHYTIIRRRIREHRCPACGFIIAPRTCASGLCSECGAKLPRSFGVVTQSRP